MVVVEGMTLDDAELERVKKLLHGIIRNYYGNKLGVSNVRKVGERKWVCQIDACYHAPPNKDDSLFSIDCVKNVGTLKLTVSGTPRGRVCENIEARPEFQENTKKWEKWKAVPVEKQESEG